MASPTEMYNAGLIPGGSRVVIFVSKGARQAETSSLVVPEVRGKNQGAALEAFSHAGLASQVVYDYHKLARKGEVAAQYPDAGTEAVQGSAALIIVSSGPALNEQAAVRIPSTIGKTEEQAIAAIKSAGLSPQVVHDYHDEQEEGLVFAQLPSTASYSSGTPKRRVFSWLLILLLAALIIFGSYFAASTVPQIIENRRTEVSVPTLLGKSKDEASKALNDAGLKLGDISYTTAQSSKDKVGSVAASDPASGKKLPRGGVVNLTLFAEKKDAGKTEEPLKEVELLEFVGMTKEDAIAAIKRLGLKYKTEESSNAASAGSVFDQDPQAGTSVKEGSVVRLYISTGPVESTLVEVPSVLGSSQADAERLISERGLKVAVDESSNAAPKGQVFDQSPSAGKQVEPGSVVKIFISTGPAEEAPATTEEQAPAQK